MPQIGWFEILIVVVLAIIIIGPKDFPKVLRMIGNWSSAIKRYFTDIQKDMKDIKETAEDSIAVQEKQLNQNKDKKKDE